jgi:hypothetical protein
MERIGIETFRIRNLEKPENQKGRFRELTKRMREMIPSESPRIFMFTDNIRLSKGL